MEIKTIVRIILAVLVAGIFYYVYTIHHAYFGILLLLYLVIVGVIWNVKFRK